MPAVRQTVSRTLHPEDLLSEQYPGTKRYVRASTGNDSNDGLTWATAKKTVQAAIDDCGTLDRIHIALGTYTENLTIPKSLTGLTLIGAGPRPGLVAATDGVALTVEANNVTLHNLVIVGDGTGGAIVNRGRRLRAYGCKIQSGAIALNLTLGTDAQITAGTHEKGDDTWFVDCEIAWATKGVVFTGTDYGAVTQARFRGCTFHDNSSADFEESVGSGGSAAVTFRDVDVRDCVFLRKEDGSEPTGYVLLNDDNTNTGVFANNSFPTAIGGGKNLVSTKVIWVSNLHTGGISTGQPS